MRYPSLITAAIVLATLGLSIGSLAQPPPDACHKLHTERIPCDRDNTTAGGGCTWCESKAIPSACYTVRDAKALPSSVFVCDDPTGQCRPGDTACGKHCCTPQQKCVEEWFSYSCFNKTV